jgi:hypothetical protein
MNRKTKDYLKLISLLIEFSALIGSLIWIRHDCNNLEPFITFLCALGVFIGTLFTIKIVKEKNLKTSRLVQENEARIIRAKVIEHSSEERRVAFNQLRQNITTGDEIWILGTGVTSFLNDRENLESYLRNGARIRILMINDKLLKNSKECINSLASNNSVQDKSTLERILVCDIENWNFLIRKKHFDNYFKREGYHEDVSNSYNIIDTMQKKIKDESWDGSLDARHFLSFLPLSMTAIRTKAENRKMIIEFVLPFTEKRILLNSSSGENGELYELFIDFFTSTWKRSKNIKETW